MGSISWFWETAAYGVILLEARVCRKCCDDVAHVPDSVMYELGVQPTDILPLLTDVGVVAAVPVLENVGAEVGHMAKAIIIVPGDDDVRGVEVAGQGTRENVFVRQSIAKCVEEGHRHEGDEKGDRSHLDGEMG